MLLILEGEAMRGQDTGGRGLAVFPDHLREDAMAGLVERFSAKNQQPDLQDRIRMAREKKEAAAKAAEEELMGTKHRY